MRAWSITIVVVAALLILYVGSYVLLVQRAVYFNIDRLNPRPWQPPPDPHYRVGGSLSKALFAPCHFVDRRLRADYWSLSGVFSAPREELVDRLEVDSH